MGMVAPPPTPPKRGLQWWHWLLIAGGGIIAVTCVLCGSLYTLGIIVASNAPTPSYPDTTPVAFPSPTAFGPTGATCDLTTHHCSGAPRMFIDRTHSYEAWIQTTKGTFVLQLSAQHAPIASNNFLFLAEQKWYDGTHFWRAKVPGTPSPIDPSGAPSQPPLIQGGSINPNGLDPSNVPGYTIRDDSPMPTDYTAGTVAMASSAPNSGTAQFFIDVGDETPYLAKN